MKIRNGFVSNSSSSSFVIGYSTSEACPHCGRKDIDIVELINRSSEDDTYVSIEGFVEVIEELNSWMDDDAKHIIAEMEKLNDEKHKFAIVRVSYNNEIVADMIRHNSSVTILYGDDN